MEHIMFYIHNWKYYLKHIKWFFQRITRGYSDKDLWDFSGYLCDIISKALKQLAGKHIGHPITLTDNEWIKILFEISYSFEDAKKLLEIEYDTDEEGQELMEKFNYGMDLFKQYFFSFWD